MGKTLTEETISQIKKMYTKDRMSQGEIAKALGIHRNSVLKYLKSTKYEMFKSLGNIELARYVTDLWPLDDVEYLVEWWPVETSADIAYALDKERHQVESKLISLKRDGIVGHKTPVGERMCRRSDTTAING